MLKLSPHNQEAYLNDSEKQSARLALKVNTEAAERARAEHGRGLNPRVELKMRGHSEEPKA